MLFHINENLSLREDHNLTSRILKELIVSEWFYSFDVAVCAFKNCEIVIHSRMLKGCYHIFAYFDNFLNVKRACAAAKFIRGMLRFYGKSLIKK